MLYSSWELSEKLMAACVLVSGGPKMAISICSYFLAEIMILMLMTYEITPDTLAVILKGVEQLSYFGRYYFIVCS